MKTINRVKSANCHLKKFLSTFSFLIISAEALSDDLTINVLLISSSKGSSSKYSLPNNLVPHEHCVIGYQVVQSGISKEYVQFLATSHNTIQPLTPDANLKNI